MQDFFLIHNMKCGDEAAMDAFVRKYYPQILQYCRYHCPDRQWAQDLTQETFERFFRNLADYQHLGKAAAYLYTIARNLCIDWGKKNREIPSDADILNDRYEFYVNHGNAINHGNIMNYGNAMGYGNAGNYEKSGIVGSPEKTEADRVDERLIIEEALQKLPEELREVVILHYFQEFNVKETAGILKIGVPLAKYRLKRAREQLGEFLERGG